MSETIQDRLNELEKRSAADAAEIREIREQLAKAEKPGPWVPKLGEQCLVRYNHGGIDTFTWCDDPDERACSYRDRIAPHTIKGHAKLERDDRAEKFRASWKRAADVAPDKPGYVPGIPYSHSVDGVVSLYTCLVGWPKFSTIEKCNAWVESEGQDVVREMLTGGLW
jgi:hypothetical protein